MSSQLQHKLFQYEVEPPAGMWDAISNALDEQATPASEKLRTFEATPPPQLWQQIETELDSESDVPSRTIPFYRRYPAALRYGGAVAVLLLVAVTITLLVNSSGTNTVAQQSTTSQPTGKTVRATSPEVTVRTTEGREQQGQQRQSEEWEERTGSGTASLGDKDRSVSKTPERPSSSRYLTVATEEGQAVRLSKKVYPVFDCAEHSSSLERFQCQENIEALQKMASSLGSPSGDFASLIDMIKTLEENR
jgi:hypothetical protein